jgi:hypothetical protein
MMLAFLAGALAACGTAQPMPDFNTFAHRVSDDTVVLYWNCSRSAPGVVRVAGVANNPFYGQPIQDLELRVYGVNAQGGNVSRARGSTQDYLIQMNSPSRFTVDLKTVGSEVRYDLVYSYLIEAGGSTREAAGGEQQNFARNICAGLTRDIKSETRNRNSKQIRMFGANSKLWDREPSYNRFQSLPFGFVWFNIRVRVTPCTSRNSKSNSK